MTLSTLPELQAQYAALSARIAAIDREIALETDRERRAVAQAKRDELAHERERVAADIMLQGGTPQADVHIEHRVTVLERDIRKLWDFVRPGPRQVVARIIFWGLFVFLSAVWIKQETSDWLVEHPAQAVSLTLVVVLAMLLIRWLPEDDHDQR